MRSGAVLRLSKLTDYAVLVLACIGEARPDAALQTAPALAARTALPEPTVAKVLKILAQSGLVEGLRGARGGYRLARPLTSIPLAEVIVAFDGPIALTACVDGGDGSCHSEGSCPVRGRWNPVNAAIRGALAGITIADLAPPAGAGAEPPFIPDPEFSLAAE
jgi:FeS assembly SUF system regulator